MPDHLSISSPSSPADLLRFNRSSLEAVLGGEEAEEVTPHPRRDYHIRIIELVIPPELEVDQQKLGLEHQQLGVSS